MSNTLTIPSTNPFANYERDQATRRHFPGELMKFNKGDYVAGKDGVLLPSGSQLVAVMNTLTRGWQRWENNELTDARLGFYVEGFKPPRRSELGDHDKSRWETGKDGKPRDTWSYINALAMVSPETMKTYTFITGTSGGIRAIDDLADDHGAAPPGKYPLISLEADSYLHSDRTIGRVKVPLFRVVGQVDATPYDLATAKARGERAPTTEALPTRYPAESLTYMKAPEPPPILDNPDGDRDFAPLDNSIPF